MELDVYALKQSASNLSFILSQRKQGRKFYALGSSPLTTCLNWYDMIPYPTTNGERT